MRLLLNNNKNFTSIDNKKLKTTLENVFGRHLLNYELLDNVV
jgi:hypothetical protein